VLFCSKSLILFFGAPFFFSLFSQNRQTKLKFRVGKKAEERKKRNKMQQERKQRRVLVVVVEILCLLRKNEKI
jgi:hypothetical protein